MPGRSQHLLTNSHQNGIPEPTLTLKQPGRSHPLARNEGAIRGYARIRERGRRAKRCQGDARNSECRMHAAAAAAAAARGGIDPPFQHKALHSCDSAWVCDRVSGLAASGNLR